MINAYQLLLNHINVRARLALGNVNINRLHQNQNTIDSIEKSYVANLLLNHIEHFQMVKIDTPLDFSNIPILNTFTFAVITDWTNVLSNSNYRIIEVEKDYLPKQIEKNTIYMFRTNTGAFAYFPMYFTIGTYMSRSNLDLVPIFTKFDLQLAHLINITEQSPLKVNKQTITTPVDIDDVKRKLLKEELNGLSNSIQNNNYRQKIVETMRYIENTRAQIKQKEKEIKQYEELMKKLEESELYKKIDDVTASLFSLLDRNKLIDKVDIFRDRNHYVIDILTHELPWNKFDPNQLETMLPNIWNDYPGFKKYLYQVLRKEATLYFGKYNLRYIITPEETIHINIERDDSRYFNPHEDIHCLGGYRQFIEDYIERRDITNLILTHLEFLRHITLGDGGSSDLPNCCYIKNQEGEIIYDGRSDQKYQEEEEEEYDYEEDIDLEPIDFTATDPTNR